MPQKPRPPHWAHRCSYHRSQPTLLAQAGARPDPQRNYDTCLTSTRSSICRGFFGVDKIWQRRSTDPTEIFAASSRHNRSDTNCRLQPIAAAKSALYRYCCRIIASIFDLRKRTCIDFSIPPIYTVAIIPARLRLIFLYGGGYLSTILLTLFPK